MPALAVLAAVCALGARSAPCNGALVAYARIPSIVVTLATMVALRDALRWATQGAWVQDLPRGFQWFGLAQAAYPLVAGAARARARARRSRGVCAVPRPGALSTRPARTRTRRGWPASTRRASSCAVFALAGALTGLAAVLNAVRFNQIPSNAGLGLEMKVIAAVVVGGAAITGGRGTIAGTRARRRAARRDRPGADVPRRERVLGARAPGRDHPRRRCRWTRARTPRLQPRRSAAAAVRAR